MAVSIRDDDHGHANAREINSAGDADAGPDHWILRRRHPIAGDDDAVAAGHQVGAVEAAVQPEGLRELAGPAGQIVVAARSGAQFAHALQAQQRLDGPQQHRYAFAHFAADNVAAPVHAVSEVDIEVAGLTEHAGRTRRLTAIGVCGRIDTARVGFDFNNAAGSAIVTDQELVEQLGRNLDGRAPVEAAGRI